MPTCSTCRHFFVEASACRRYPPQVVVLTQQMPKGVALIPRSLFPKMEPGSCCGEHQAAEAH